MGSACCVAAKDRTVTSGSTSEIMHRNVRHVAAKDRTVTNASTSEIMHRNIRHSPSWSFRWDNRVRVVGEDTSVNWISDGVTRNSPLDIKSGPTIETAYASEEGSPLDSFRSFVWQKSPVSEVNNGLARHPTSGTSLCCCSSYFSSNSVYSAPGSKK